jgi:hypothetical protein
VLERVSGIAYETSDKKGRARLGFPDLAPVENNVLWAGEGVEGGGEGQEERCSWSFEMRPWVLVVLFVAVQPQ